ncbi:MAG: segregation and condensation protein A [Thermoguttaceae bacterium]
MDFRVDLSIFRGPMDLLLFLVRRHELEITDIPIAAVTEQYLQYLALAEQLDVDAVGDFLAMAATLIELKSQQVLPGGDEVEEQLEDPREELVRRLLEYKQYRDAASILEQRSRRWQDHYPRADSDLPAQERDPADQPIQELELWDLVSAFARILRDTELARPSSIVYDETPIHVYMTGILERVRQRGRLAFATLFEARMLKSTLIGIFLAVLELVRHHLIRVEQNALFGQIWLVSQAGLAQPVDFSRVDDYYEPARN